MPRPVIRRGPLSVIAVFFLRRNPRFRPLVASLIGIGGLIAGRISVALPPLGYIGLIIAAIAGIPVVYQYLSDPKDLRVRLAKTLLKKAGGALAALARSDDPDDLRKHFGEHYPHWMAPGVEEALRDEAKKLPL